MSINLSIPKDMPQAGILSPPIFSNKLSYLPPPAKEPYPSPGIVISKTVPV